MSKVLSMTEKKDSRDRVSINLEGLRDKIWNFRDDASWRSLSLSKQVRILIETALGIDSTKKTHQDDEGE